MTAIDTIKHIHLRLKTLSGYLKIMLTSDSIVMTDGKDLQTEIDELNSKLVVESGSNSNGYYRKWADGTLEQWGQAQFNATTSASQTSTVSFPTSFVNTSFSYFMQLQQNGNVCTGYWEGNAGGNIQRTGESTVCYCSKATTNYRIVFNWFAVGRWE